MLRKCCVLLAASCLVALTSCSRKEQPANAGSSSPPVAGDAADPALPMVGFVDVPVDGARVRGEFGVGGWVLWGQGVQTVELLLDGAPLGAAVQTGVARPDVAQAHPEYHNPNSGWGTSLSTANLPAGEHKLTVRVKSPTGATEDLKTLTLKIAKP